MKLQAGLLLLLALLAETFASEESCMGRCEIGFDSDRKCQCDSMCKYYKSCCSDFEVTCGMMTRGDTFVFAEDDDDDDELGEGTTPSSVTASSPPLRPTRRPTSDFSQRRQQHPETTLDMTRPPRLIKPRLQPAPVVQYTPSSETVPAPELELELSLENSTTPEPTTAPITPATTEGPDPDAVLCSGRPFDSFMRSKNGSVYAFRGEYFFEMDQNSVLPGYPKLIKDVWGISGPIDAAFTRVNCQGKTYIFKGNKYWRFNDGVLDEDYPRAISVGFGVIPDHLDAAFALPAPGHNGKEKVYFFKGDQYYTYEFLHQHSHEECVAMSQSSPSALFRSYTDVYYNNFERFLGELFSNAPQGDAKYHFIEKDWKGLKAPVDAVLIGRMYVPPQRSGRPPGWLDQQWGRRRQRRSPFWEGMAQQGMNVGQGFAEKGMELGLKLAEKRMEMEERLGRDRDGSRDQDWDQYRRRDQDWDQYRRRDQDWDQYRRRDQDWDQFRRWDRYNSNNRGNYDSRRDGWYPESFQRDLPIQNVFFFRGDKYYRVDLRTKRVDHARPPYPRSIGKHWLGCSDATGAEK